MQFLWEVGPAGGVKTEDRGPGDGLSSHVLNRPRGQHGLHAGYLQSDVAGCVGHPNCSVPLCLHTAADAAIQGSWETTGLLWNIY